MRKLFKKTILFCSVEFSAIHMVISDMELEIRKPELGEVTLLLILEWAKFWQCVSLVELNANRWLNLVKLSLLLNS